MNRDKLIEKQAEEAFRDWMSWTGPAPKEDDPDFYTYNWGLQVWINCTKQKLAQSPQPTDKAVNDWYTRDLDSIDESFWQEAPYRTHGDILEEIKEALKHFNQPVNAEENIDLKSIEAKIDDALENHPPQPDQVKEEEIESYALSQLPDYSDNETERIIYHDGIMNGAKWMQTKLNK